MIPREFSRLCTSVVSLGLFPKTWKRTKNRAREIKKPRARKSASLLITKTKTKPTEVFPAPSFLWEEEGRGARHPQKMLGPPPRSRERAPG